MQTLYFIVFTVLGGLLAIFLSAGWSSYTEKKLPDITVLFRWALTGTLTAGLAAYAWIFGANGDPSAMIEQVGNVLEVQNVVKGLSESIAPAEPVAEPVKAQKSPARDITVGMPTF